MNQLRILNDMAGTRSLRLPSLVPMSAKRDTLEYHSRAQAQAELQTEFIENRILELQRTYGEANCASKTVEVLSVIAVRQAFIGYHRQIGQGILLFDQHEGALAFDPDRLEEPSSPVWDVRKVQARNVSRLTSDLVQMHDIQLAVANRQYLT